MRIKFFGAVALSIFAATGCSSSSPETAGSGLNGGEISPNKKPSAIQLGCGSQDVAECTRYYYDSHGEPEKTERCSQATCEQWCQSPEVACHKHEFDSNGFVIKDYFSDGCTGYYSSCSVYTNDERGNHTSIRNCDGSASENDKCYEYTYDERGRIATLLDYFCQSGLGQCGRYFYDEHDRAVKVETSVGTCSDPVAFCTVYEYDGNAMNIYTSADGCGGNMNQVGCAKYYY